MTVLAGSPETLRAAAHVLSSRAVNLHAAARAVRQDCAETAASWEGTASMCFAARAGQAAGALASTGDQLGELAAATSRYAGQLDSAQQQVRALTRERDHARADLAQAQLRVSDAAAPAPGGANGVGPRRLVTESQRQLSALCGAVDDVASEQLLRAQQLEALLRSLDPGATVPEWMHDTIGAGRSAAQAIKTVSKARLLRSYLGSLRRMRTALRADDLGTHLREGKAAAEGLRHFSFSKASRGMHVLPRPAAQAIRGSGRLFLPGTMIGGAVDVSTGGGYEGWRDGTTRTLGGAAVVGGGVLLLGGAGVAFAPVTLAVAGVAVTGYTAWKAGNFAWDHRAQIARFAAPLWRGAGQVWRAHQWVAERAVGDPARALASRASRVVARGIDGAAAAARRMRDRAAQIPGLVRERVTRHVEQAERVERQITPLSVTSREMLRKLGWPITLPIGPFTSPLALIW